jgi:hypothetical protein
MLREGSGADMSRVDFDFLVVKALERDIVAVVFPNPEKNLPCG